MITIDDVKRFSKPHQSNPEKAKQTIFFNEQVLISIVGGERGLYGDFEEDFEVALFTPDMKDFITKYFIDTSHDDVIPYMKADELEILLNKLFRKGFQVK